MAMLMQYLRILHPKFIRLRHSLGFQMRNGMKLIKFLLLSCLLVLVSCSSRAHLCYAPSVEPKLPKRAVSIDVGTVEDARADKKCLGRLENAFGMSLVDITAEEDVTEWARKALKLELSQSGYSEGQGYVLDCQIEEALSYLYFCNFGVMKVQMTLKKEEAIIFQRIYQMKVNAGVSWSLLPGTLSQECLDALELCLRTICKQFITDLNRVSLEPHK